MVKTLQEQIAAKKAEEAAKNSGGVATTPIEEPTPEPTPEPAPEPTPEPTPEPKISSELERLGALREVKASVVEKTKEEPKRPEVILRNTTGEKVPVSDYFFNGVVPAGFEGTCGNPVDREELLTVFNKVFKPEDNILFYKQADKEVYLVIVPIKYSSAVGDSEDSIDGDFQKHAISFLDEGSVNLDTLRKKLDRVVGFVKYTDR